MPRDAAGAAGQLPLDLSLPLALAPGAAANPRRWLEQAARAWAEIHARPMTVRWARDVALLKPLLRQHGWDELAARWCAYIATGDPFLARRGWDVPTFSTCVDRYVGDRDCAADIAWNNLRPLRDPLTGAVLGRRRGW